MKTISLISFLLIICTSIGQSADSNPTTFTNEVSLVIQHTEIDYYIIQDQRSDIIDFTQGFLDGIGATKVFNEIEGCLTDSEYVLLNITIAIEDLKTKDPEQVREGIRILGQVAKLIPDAAKLCRTADADIRKIIKLIKSFTNPASFFYHAGKSLLINHVEVFKEIVNAMIAYEKQDYREVGYWVGKAMNSIFLKSSKQLQDIIDPQSNMIDFVKGFLNGVGFTQVYNTIEDCLVDSEKVLADLGVGIQDLQTKDPEKVREGIRVLGQAAKIIPDAAKLCKAADADMKEIIRLIKTFTNPTSIIYHAGKSLLIDRVEVFEEIMNAIVAYGDQNYTELGYWIGKAMDTIFLKSPQDTSSDVLAFVEGFLQGVGSASAFDEIRECVNDSETVVSDLATAVEDIESKTPAKVKAGIQLIGQAVQIVPDAVEICKASEVDLKTLLKMVESFKNPVSFLYYIGKSIIINHVEVTTEVSNAVAAYEKQDYNQLGYWVGKAMDTILLGQPSQFYYKFSEVESRLVFSR